MANQGKPPRAARGGTRGQAELPGLPESAPGVGPVSTARPGRRRNAEPPSLFSQFLAPLPSECGPLSEGLPTALPLRVRAMPGESLNGLMLRLAERNGVADPADLVRGSLRWYPTLALTEAELARFSALSGLPAEAVRATYPRFPPRASWRDRAPATFMGQELRGTDLTTVRRVCPACLAEGTCHRAAWTVVALAGCPLHGRALVQACACGRALEWSAPSLSCRRCGAGLDGLPLDGWAPFGLEVAAWVELRLAGRHFGIALLDVLRMCDVLELLRWIGTLAWRPGMGWSAAEIHGRGFEYLVGPRDRLVELVRGRAGLLERPGSAKVGAGRLQPELAGLLGEEHEVVAALVREAAR